VVWWSRTGGARCAASSQGCDASHGGRQMAVDYTTHDGVAVITLNNPPVNGLGLSTRAGIVEGI